MPTAEGHSTTPSRTPTPLATLAAWIDEARADGDPEPSAMALATVDPDGQPSVRYVLCKDVTERGVEFFTNLTSRKGTALAHEPRAAVTFWFAGLERSVRITGKAHLLPRERVNDYFARRPRGSRLGAFASHQSQPIAGRAALEARAPPPTPPTPNPARPSHRTSGAATNSSPTRSSSGKAETTGSTTGSATSEMRPAGRRSGSNRERDPPPARPPPAHPQRPDRAAPAPRAPRAHRPQARPKAATRSSNGAPRPS